MKSVQVDFFADLTCPWCYVAWEALKRAQQERSAIALNVTWRPFLLSPQTPKEGVDRKQSLAERFTPAEIKRVHDELHRRAAAVGAPLNIDAATRFPNTVDAHRLVHWTAVAKKPVAPMIEALYKAYFIEGKDIGAKDVLVAIAQEQKLDARQIAAKLDTAEDSAAIYNAHASAIQSKIDAVPMVAFNHGLRMIGAQEVNAYVAAIDHVSK